MEVNPPLYIIIYDDDPQRPNALVMADEVLMLQRQQDDIKSHTLPSVRHARAWATSHRPSHKTKTQTKTTRATY